MNPTGEWNEYAQLVITTIKRLEKEIQSLKELREQDKQEFIQKLDQIRSDFLSDVEKIRSEFRDREVERLETQLANALNTIAAQKKEAEDSVIAREAIVRDHKVDSFFASRSRMYWVLFIGGVGTVWAIVEFLIEPFLKG